MTASDTIQFAFENLDVTTCPADVAAFKYARKFYGADLSVRDVLVRYGIPEDQITPNDGDHALVNTRGAILPRQALFIGTPRIGSFQYDVIREFVKLSLSVLQKEAADTRFLAMTIHGIGAGLDEAECALAQLEGALSAIQAGAFPPALNRIMICERDAKRTERIQKRLENFLSQSGFPTRLQTTGRWGIEVQKPATAS